MLDEYQGIDCEVNAIHVNDWAAKRRQTGFRNTIREKNTERFEEG